jgi:hypothetical protein
MVGRFFFTSIASMKKALIAYLEEIKHKIAAAVVLQHPIIHNIRYLHLLYSKKTGPQLEVQYI